MSIKDLWAGIDETETEILNLIRKDGFFKLNISHIKKNREIIHLKIQSNPIMFDGKEARVALANNITASLETKRALKNSEQRFKALVQDGSELVMILNFDGNLTYVSPSSKLVIGITAEVLINYNLFEFINYIETIERHNNRLKVIARTQSHVVRAPLSRIMGLIDSLENFENMDDQAQLLSHILTSARELDGIIRKINSKTVESISQSPIC
jgi:PAS domain-containing protein